MIGLALILLFGRSGAASRRLWEWFGIPRSRWIYGLPGVLIAQLLAFTPIAFLVLIGVVQGISPTLEEASQTLRAKSWTTFRTITLPLMRPGLANAFLLGFVESMADFGNPLVLGGNFEVLSTKIFFAVVGAAHDQGRAAVLSIILLAFTLGGLLAAARLARQEGLHDGDRQGRCRPSLPLPRRVAIASYATAIPWALFTFVVYAIIMVGGFVRSMGRDYTADPRAPPHRLPIERPTRGSTSRAPPGTRSSRPSRSRRSRRRSPPPSACSPPTCSRASASPASAPSSSARSELRHPRHRRGRVVHSRLQRAADRDHRNGLHPRDVLRVPEHAGGRALGHRDLEPDRQEPRRGLAHPRRALRHHHAPRRAAAAAPASSRRSSITSCAP